MALYGQVNYHPDRSDTTKTPYIDWVNKVEIGFGNWPDYQVQVVDADGPSGVSDPSRNINKDRIYGNPPMNILYRDISTTNKTVYSSGYSQLLTAATDPNLQTRTMR